MNLLGNPRHLHLDHHTPNLELPPAPTLQLRSANSHIKTNTKLSCQNFQVQRSPEVRDCVWIPDGVILDHQDATFPGTFHHSRCGVNMTSEWLMVMTEGEIDIGIIRHTNRCLCGADHYIINICHYDSTPPTLSPRP